MTYVVHFQRKNDIFNFGSCTDVNELMVVLPSGTEDNSVVGLAFTRLNDNLHVLQGILVWINKPGMIHSVKDNKANQGINDTSCTDLDLDNGDINIACSELWKLM